jgi:pilus assembly protein CpaF
VDLHERLASTRPAAGNHPGPDPFAELKNKIHFDVIAELGGQLFNVAVLPGALRERVTQEIRTHLTQQPGLSQNDHERLTAELADDILGHGPLERLIADDSVTEIMVNGPHDVWVERQGRLYLTTVQFNDESHL